MKTFKFFALLFVISLAGCVQRQNNTVVIHSVPADSIFTEINLFALPAGELDITFEGGKTCRFTIDTVQVCNFYGTSDENRFFTQIFITPGDAVSLKTIPGEDYYDLLFEGKNAAHYNYVSQKRKSFPWEEEPNYFSNPDIDLLEYKQQLLVYRDRENGFLSNYKKEHTVSEDFINYASAEINNLYAFKLYQAAYFNKHSLPAGYLEDAVITQNPLSMDAMEAMRFKYIYCSSDVNIERIYNAILDEVCPKLQPSLLAGLIAWFTEKGDRVYKESLLQVMDQIEKTSTDHTLLAQIKESRAHYLLSGTILPDSILDKTYLRPLHSTQKITLRQFFDNYKNRAIYLDLWASWCNPCRDAARESAIGKSYLAGKQITVVYISIDADESAWVQAAIEDGIMDNQYLLLHDNDRPVYSYLKIRSIPRYVLFNKNHEIEVLSGPRPTQRMFEDLKEIIERYSEKL